MAGQLPTAGPAPLLRGPRAMQALLARQKPQPGVAVQEKQSLYIPQTSALYSVVADPASALAV